MTIAPLSPAPAAVEVAPSTAAAGPRIGAAGCVDGLITVATADGPVEYACLAPCCAQTRAAARAERAAVAAASTAWSRMPQVDDEAW